MRFMLFYREVWNGKSESHQLKIYRNSAKKARLAAKNLKKWHEAWIEKLREGKEIEADTKVELILDKLVQQKLVLKNVKVLKI